MTREVGGSPIQPEGPHEPSKIPSAPFDFQKITTPPPSEQVSQELSLAKGFLSKEDAIALDLPIWIF